MVFSSFIFVLVFLPLHLAIYFFVPDDRKNIVLLVSSLVFYAWGGPVYVFLLAGEAAISWFCARQMENNDEWYPRTLWLVIGVCALLTLLGYFKYAGLIVGTVKAITSWPPDVPQVVLPIGISFYTFQLISYMVDVYRGTVSAQPVYWKLLLYCSLFHQCIAGPIVRYETVEKQIEHRDPKGADLYAGVRRFAVGLAKKCLLANACAAVADELLPIGTEGLMTQQVTGLWLGMLFYMLQIYLDFSAYSDMAIGLGRMIGFRYLENFDHPYESASVREFWQRWHISLGTFFRDYVYIPLGGSRCSTNEYIRNMCVVWLLTGLWHGASWNYVAWGAYFLVFLLLERFVIKDKLPRWAGHILTLLVVYLGWVLFKFEDAGELLGVIGGMVGLTGNGFTNLAVHTVFLRNIFLLVFSIVACTSLGTRVNAWMRAQSRENEVFGQVYAVIEAALPAVLILLAIISMAGASYNPFIYFQF